MKPIYPIKWQLTSEDVVLVVLVGLGAHLDETVEAVVVDKLVHKVLVILQTCSSEGTVRHGAIQRS